MNETYAELARGLADALMRYARERDADTRKIIAEMQHDLCQLRRGELKELTAEPTE